MLDRVRITNDSREYDFVDLYLDGRSGYILKDVTGIEPVKSELSHTVFSLVPGGTYHSGIIGTRNIVCTVGFNPDYSKGETVDELRNRLYYTIAPQNVAVLRFYKDGEVSRMITSRIESLDEASRFVKDPEIQISVIAARPYFRGSTLTQLLDLGQGVQEIEYEGDQPAGFEVTSEVLSSGVHWIEVRDLSRPGNPTVRVSGSFQTGQYFYINTRQGRKEASRVSSSGALIERRSGRMTSSGGWPTLQRGTNLIQVTSNYGGGIRSELDFRNYYSGV